MRELWSSRAGRATLSLEFPVPSWSARAQLAWNTFPFLLLLKSKRGGPYPRCTAPKEYHAQALSAFSSNLVRCFQSHWILCSFTRMTFGFLVTDRDEPTKWSAAVKACKLKGSIKWPLGSKPGTKSLFWSSGLMLFRNSSQRSGPGYSKSSRNDRESQIVSVATFVAGLEIVAG